MQNLQSKASQYRLGSRLPELAMLVFHDIGEIRVGDIHKLANRYISVEEERAVKEQTEDLGDIGTEIFSLWKQVEDQETEAGRIAFDADKLEQAFMARELIDLGFNRAIDGIEAVSRSIKTKSARALIEPLRDTPAHDWWEGLKKYT